ncbi:MAG: DUF4252 domain-containing protein [Ignavibacteria bacterium]|nr:MAG: DUF4252 domain-containing protein [Ignavibacteria bacterium]
MKKYYKVLLIVLIALVTTGCIGVNRSFREVRNYLVNNLNENLDKEIELSVGPVGLMFANIFVKFADEEYQVSDLVRQISRVQLSVYNRPEPNESNFEMLRNITQMMKKKGMKYIVRAKDGDEMSAVFLNSNKDKINKLFVVALTDEEVVLVEIKGDLNKLIELAIKQHGFGGRYARR